MDATTVRIWISVRSRWFRWTALARQIGFFADMLKSRVTTLQSSEEQWPRNPLQRSKSTAWPKTVKQWHPALVLFVVVFSATALSAADIPVTTVNDSGAGSLRQGLAGAAAGDRLAFDPLLNGTTLVNGVSLGISQPVTFLDTSSVTLADSHAFTLAQPLTVDWAGSLSLNGVLSDGSGSTGSLIKRGLGTLSLSGANSYTGGTLFQGGTLRLQNDHALGAGLLTVNNQVGNTVLDLANGVNLNNDILLRTGVIVNEGVATTSRMSGIISESGGSFGLNKTGTGALILGGANTFTGGVYVSNDGTIRVENSTALGSGTVTVSGALRLDLANGLNVGNHIFLGNHFVANVAVGTATLSGVIDEVSNASSPFTKTGVGTLILGGHNSYTGGTTIGQGTLQGDSNSLQGNMTNNGTVIFDQAGFGHYDGNISGSGSVIKTGANTLIFNGIHSDTGPTTVSVGELQVRGSMASDVQIIDSSGILSGSGTVGNVTNNGLVQPGNFGIGRLNTNGNFTQQAGGTTEIEINSLGNAAGINNDHINATGHATLGGTLNVAAVGGGVFEGGTRYTILNAAGGVSGHFANVTDNLSMFDIALTYDPNDVVIELQRIGSLHDAGTTVNQFAVGTALDNVSLTSTGGLFTLINTLGTLTIAQQRQALNQLDGELFGTTQTIGLQVGDQFQRSLTARLVNNGRFLSGGPSPESSGSESRGQSPQDSMRSWVQGYGSNGELRSDGNAAGTNFSQGGVAYGIDWGADESGAIGIAGGNSFVGFREGYAGSGQATSYQTGLYALKHNETAYWLGSANYGYNNFNSTRIVSASGINESLQGNFVGHQLGAYTETGLKFDVGWVHIQPFVGLQYLYLAQQGFDESGGPAALSVSGSQADALRSNLGGRLVVHRWVDPWGNTWTPYWHGRWVSELLSNDRIVNASFNGAPIGGTFVTHGNHLGQDHGIFGKGLSVQMTDQWSLYANYDQMVGGRIHTHTGTGGIIYTW